MKVVCNDSIKLAGIGMVPWTRLGLEQWLPGYAIASLYGWDVDSGVPPRVVALSDQVLPLPRLPKLNTQSLLNTEEFQSLLNTSLPGYDVLTYKPVTHIPPSLRDRKFLMVGKMFTETFENKAEFRLLAQDSVRFPAFAIYDRAALKPTQEAFRHLLDGRSGVVVQDEQQGGGVGTFRIKTFADYTYALKTMDELFPSRRVVVSDFLEQPKERSIQCVITRHGVFTGPLQRQIIAHPLLSNIHMPKGDKFDGGQILAADQGTSLHREAIAAARRIGELLHTKGYRGIFGVDFLLDAHGQLYVIEINPRLTGMTPLLTALFRGGQGVPFYLLHVLELGSYEYDITDHTIDHTDTGALLIVHSLARSPAIIASTPPSGTYRIEQDQLVRVSQNITMKRLKADEFIIQDYTPPGMLIKPGGRLITLQLGRQILDERSDKLYNSTIKLIEVVRRAIRTTPVQT